MTHQCGELQRWCSSAYVLCCLTGSNSPYGAARSKERCHGYHGTPDPALSPIKVPAADAQARRTCELRCVHGRDPLEPAGRLLRLRLCGGVRLCLRCQALRLDLRLRLRLCVRIGVCLHTEEMVGVSTAWEINMSMHLCIARSKMQQMSAWSRNLTACLWLPATNAGECATQQPTNSSSPLHKSATHLQVLRFRAGLEALGLRFETLCLGGDLRLGWLAGHHQCLHLQIIRMCLHGTHAPSGARRWLLVNAERGVVPFGKRLESPHHQRNGRHS